MQKTLLIKSGITSKEALLFSHQPRKDEVASQWFDRHESNEVGEEVDNREVDLLARLVYFRA